MKRIVSFKLFESLSSKAIDRLVSDYMDLSTSIGSESKIIGSYHNLIVKAIDFYKETRMENIYWLASLG